MPNGQQQQNQFYGEPIPIYDFKKGLWTVNPEVLLPRGASPYLKNVWYDEKNALSKMPGTQLLLTETNNVFSGGQCHNLFVYHTPAGQQVLIYQGMNSGRTVMKLFSLYPQSSYPAATAMTDITPSSGLTMYKKCHFANYRGKLYLANGADNLKRWDGAEWIEYHIYHEWEKERFKYLAVYDDCLFQAWSTANPNRVIFTRQNYCNFHDYYNPATAGYWRDFPTTEGDHIIGISGSPKGSFLVWKNKSLFEVFGSPVNDIDVKKLISSGKGTIDIDSVQILGDIVIFAAGDMLYMLGNRGVMVSPEDQKLQTEASIKPLTAEIRNFWATNFTLPDPSKIKEKIWAGHENWCSTLTFVNGTDAGNFKADDVGIEVDDTIVGGTSGTTGKVVYVDLTSGTSWTAGTAAGTLYLTRRYSGSFSNGEDIKIGSTKFAETADPVVYTAGWGLTYSQVNTPSVTTANPDVINAWIPQGLGSVEAHTVSTTASQTTQDDWVNLTSDYGEDQYFSQQFELDDSTVDNSICSGVLLYFKEIGDVSGDTIKVYITSENDDNKPDFNNVYAEGKLSGNFLHGLVELQFDSGSEKPEIGDKIELNGDTANTYGYIHKVVVTSGDWTVNGTAAGFFYIKNEGGSATWTDNGQININGGTSNIATVDELAVGDSSPISSGCWVFCEMDYWDKPQNLYDGNLTAKNEVHIAIKVTGDAASNYIQWGYNDSDDYADGMMVNSDSETPASQATLDYAFKVYGRAFSGDGMIITTIAFQADSDLVNWGNVYAILDTATIDDYTRNTKLTKVEYEVSSSSTFTGTWTETTNGGAIIGTNRWIKLRFTFYRPTGGASVNMDSFTLRSVRVSYNVQDLDETLISSAIFEDRYWFTCQMVDPEYSGV